MLQFIIPAVIMGMNMSAVTMRMIRSMMLNRITEQEEEEEEEETVTPSTTEPQYGGTLRILTLLFTLDPLSWDPADGVWMTGHSAAPYMEKLLMGDLTKGPRGTNEFGYTQNEWIPDEFLTGQVAESWEVRTDLDPMRIVFHIREGIQFPAKEGVMSQRELTADDVVFCLTRYRDTGRIAASRQAWIGDIIATDKYTVEVHMNEFNAFWAYLIAWGWCVDIYPPECVDAEGGLADWKNANGSGPFRLTDYVKGSSQTYEKNDLYWGRTTIDGVEYKIRLLTRSLNS